MSDIPIIYRYPSFTACFKHLNYTKRVELSRYSVQVRKVHSRTRYSLNSIFFSQNYGPVDNEGVAAEVGSGHLRIESIDYNFTHNETTGQVTIECSMAPGRQRFSNDITTARRYFQYYLTTSVEAIPNVEVYESDIPFRGLALRIPSLKWTLNGMREFPLLIFPADHTFDKLEFINYGVVLFGDHHIRKCRHLILQKREIQPEFEFGNEDRNIESYCLLTNEKIEVYIGLNYVESFVILCTRLLNAAVHCTGSSFTGIFRVAAFQKEYLWHLLREKHQNVVLGHLKGKECLVLRLTNEDIIAVFEDYFNEDTAQMESFTVIKLKRIMETDEVEELTEGLETL
ncbi:hypothetical protein GCK72_002759 [Caenorhabditis remanei]|uniref:Uncharacterized protein n=1 Tax=Caenorhabditis remanei TaxID=31234 RepID=A0A6A5HTP1_CAERE|nr:hypothetical protein GCK72_002759 [Caenorhabditis remanei]KAF1770935.1 hypothetical protein GCK72_002759 [Caenorhabditis remanei]